MAATVDDAFVVLVYVVMCCVGVARAAPVVVAAVAVVPPTVQAKDGVVTAAVDASHAVDQVADGIDDVGVDVDGDGDDAVDGSADGDDVCNVVTNVRLALLAMQTAAAADNANFSQTSTAAVADPLFVVPPQVCSIVLLRAPSV